MHTDDPGAAQEIDRGASSSGEQVPHRYQQLEHFRVPPGFRGRSKICVQLWWVVQATLFALSPQTMYGWRAWLLRLFGARVGKRTIIRPTVKIPYPWKLTIGTIPHWRRGASVHLWVIEIGTGGGISASYICTGSHDYTSPTSTCLPRRLSSKQRHG